MLGVASMLVSCNLASKNLGLRIQKCPLCQIEYFYQTDSSEVFRIVDSKINNQIFWSFYASWRWFFAESWLQSAVIHFNEIPEMLCSHRCLFLGLCAQEFSKFDTRTHDSYWPFWPVPILPLKVYWPLYYHLRDSIVVSIPAPIPKISDGHRPMTMQVAWVQIPVAECFFWKIFIKINFLYIIYNSYYYYY